MNNKPAARILLSILVPCLLAVSPLAAAGAEAGDGATNTESLKQDISNTAKDIKKEAVETYQELKGNAQDTYRKATEKPDTPATKESSENLSGYLDDATITAGVKAKFLTQKGLDSLDISVETVKGVVTLSGQVANQAQISLAEILAGEAEGVTKVVNNLTARQ